MANAPRMFTEDEIRKIVREEIQLAAAKGFGFEPDEPEQTDEPAPQPEPAPAEEITEAQTQEQKNG